MSLSLEPKRKSLNITSKPSRPTLTTLMAQATIMSTEKNTSLVVTRKKKTSLRAKRSSRLTSTRKRRLRSQKIPNWFFPNRRVQAMNALTHPTTMRKMKMTVLLRYHRVAVKRKRKTRMTIAVALVAAVIVIHMVVKVKSGRRIAK